jgi:hypothetical protein
VVQDQLLLRFGMGDTWQTNSAPFTQVKPDFEQDDLFKRVNDLCWPLTNRRKLQSSLAEFFLLVVIVDMVAV